MTLEMLSKHFDGLSSPKIHQFTQFISSETILLIVAVILEGSSSSCLSTATSICGCVLFGKVIERKRILEGGNRGWCVLPILMQITAIVCSLFLLWSIRRGKIRSRSTYYKALGLVTVSAFLTFLASVIISQGIQKWCDSFVINKCVHDHIRSMDWKKFTPKYSDCGHIYQIMDSAKMCSWCACALRCVLSVTLMVRLIMGLQAS